MKHCVTFDNKRCYGGFVVVVAEFAFGRKANCKRWEIQKRALNRTGDREERGGSREEETADYVNEQLRWYTEG